MSRSLRLAAVLVALAIGTPSALAQGDPPAPGETPGASPAAAPPGPPSLAQELLAPRRSFLPMPLSRPMMLPQQEAPGVVVSEARTEPDAAQTPADALPSVDLAASATSIPSALLATAPRGQEPLRLAHYAFGAYQRGLYQTAFNVALRASADNDPSAAALIGRLYEEAKGVDQDLDKAAGWYAVAADLGDAYAQTRLAAMLLMGRGVPKDSARAAEVFEAAANKGSADAAHSLALLLIKGEGRDSDIEAAFTFMKRAAERGDHTAQHALAIMYEQGQGTVPDDVAATKWYAHAAQSGDPAASFAYGERLLRGIGTDADRGRAAPYLAIAARAGNPNAMNRYARLLADGGDVTPDAAEAVKWHLLARAAGVSDLYLDGFIGTRDPAIVAEGRARAARFGGLPAAAPTAQPPGALQGPAQSTP